MKHQQQTFKRTRRQSALSFARSPSRTSRPVRYSVTVERVADGDVHAVTLRLETARDHERVVGVEAERARAAEDGAVNTLLVALTLVVDLQTQTSRVIG